MSTETWAGPAVVSVTVGAALRRAFRRTLLASLPLGSWQEDRGLLTSLFVVRVPAGKNFTLTLPD